MKVYELAHWQYWYDRTYKCWYAAEFNTKGDQVSECIDSYTKTEIIDLILKEINYAKTILT